MSYIKRAVGYGLMTALVGIGYFALQMGTRTMMFTTLFGEVGELSIPSSSPSSLCFYSIP